MRSGRLRIAEALAAAVCVSCAMALGLLVAFGALADDAQTGAPLQIQGEDEFQGRVARLSEELSRIEEQVNRWEWSLAEARDELVAKQEEIASIGQELDVSRASLSATLRALYRYRRGMVLRALVSPGGIEQVDLRLRYQRCLLGWQAEQVEHFRRRLVAFRQTMSELSEMEARIEALRDRLLVHKGEMLREKLATELGMTDAEQMDVAGAPAPLSAERSEQAGVFSLAKLRPAFTKRKGHLPWPVDAVRVEYYNYGSSGEVGPGGEEHGNRGIEVKAAEGEAIFPVAEGWVVFAGPLRGYGRLVILDHGGSYYSLYGYIRELFVGVGQQVGMRDAIGTLGRGGRHREPMLYFEIRHYGQPEDPLTWLEKLTAAGATASLVAPAGSAR